jgi:hypothetical protein
MAIESATYISDLVATNPVGATDTKATLDDHIRLVKSTVKATFPNVSGAVTPTHTQLNTVPDLAPKASPTFTGTPLAPNPAAGTNTTQIATMAAVNTAIAAAGLGSSLPALIAGRALYTDGAVISWFDPLGFPVSTATTTALGFKADTTAVQSGFDLKADLPGNNEVWLHTGNGHGAVNTKIRRFTTAVTNTGTAITYADSANSGASFTINETGLYAIYYGDSRTSAGVLYGVSLNSAELTTAIETITAANRLALGYSSTINSPQPLCRVVRLVATDVIRPHTDGAADTTTHAMFAIRKVSDA